MAFVFGLMQLFFEVSSSALTTWCTTNGKATMVARSVATVRGRPTSNVFSVAGSLGAKAYLKQNPPKLDVELKELGIDDESAGVKIPATLEEALVDASAQIIFHGVS